MPGLVLKETGQTIHVPSELLDKALATGLYEPPSADTIIPVTTGAGLTGGTTYGDLERVRQSPDRQLETESGFRERENQARIEREYGGTGGTLAAGAVGLARGASGGFSDLALRGLGVDPETLRDLETAHPVVSKATEGVGLVGSAVAAGGAGALGKTAALSPVGAATRAGTALAKRAGGGFGGAALGGAIEGAILGAGSGASEVALEDDPVTVERLASSISSKMVLGAGGGALGGVAAKAFEKGLARGARMVDDWKTGAQARAAGSVDDVAEKAAIADEVAALRQTGKEAKPWLATEDKSLRKAMIRADRTVDRLTDNMKGLAQRPQRALDALQQSEQALEKIVKAGDDLRAKIQAEVTAGAVDAGKSRLASLDGATQMLERNRALQARIEQMAAAPAAAGSGFAGQVAERAGRNVIRQATEGVGFGAVLAALPTIPVVGPVAAPMIAGKITNTLTDLVFNRGTKLSAEAAARTAGVVKTFMNATSKVAPAVPPVASKTLSSVAFGPDKEDPAPLGDTNALHALYRKREREIRSQIVETPDGPKLKPAARMQIADNLRAVRAFSPILADKIETVAVRKVEFYASKLPRRSDMAALQLGPDRWKPSEMKMRELARYVAAGEDPDGVEQRLLTGQVTPEDAEAYRAIYPERFEDFKRQVVENLPNLRASLPYKRRVALSIFTGVPVDPAMHPDVLRVLQSQYAEEPGSEGGTQAPRAAPQFGSISKPEPTEAQQRAG